MLQTFTLAMNLSDHNLPDHAERKDGLFPKGEIQDQAQLLAKDSFQ